MRASGYVAAAVLVAGAAVMPTPAAAAVFTLNSCASGACGSFTGSVTIAINDNLSDTNDVDLSITNNSNGDIDYLLFGYATNPTGAAQITNLSATPSNSVAAPSASFGSGNDAGFAYNVSIDFPNPAGGRFDAGDAVNFTLGSSNHFNFNASSFSPVLAHVISLSIGGQSVKITTGGGGSSGGGGQTVPEPASLALFGFAALAFANRIRRRPAK